MKHVKKGENMKDAKKIKEVEEVCNEAANFILSLEEEFFLEEIELISLLIEEMKEALNTGSVESVKKVIRDLKIIGENRTWEMIEAYEY